MNNSIRIHYTKFLSGVLVATHFSAIGEADWVLIVLAGLQKWSSHVVACARAGQISFGFPRYAVAKRIRNRFVPISHLSA